MQGRTDAYRDAVVANPTLLKNAVVMDVGFGTGILRYINVVFPSCPPSLPYWGIVLEVVDFGEVSYQQEFFFVIQLRNVLVGRQK